jgi:hypothetical protein
MIHSIISRLELKREFDILGYYAPYKYACYQYTSYQLFL